MGRHREALADELDVLACRSGDTEAFRRLVGRWQERLWRHAFRLTGREDVAWDVLQESWLAIARGIRSLEEPSGFRSWAYRIVQRRAADHGRRARPTEALDEAKLADPALAEEPDERELLRRALARLAPERRALLALRYADGLELAEIAEVLDVPEGTVKSRLHHARAELRDVLERLDAPGGRAR